MRPVVLAVVALELAQASPHVALVVRVSERPLAQAIRGSCRSLAGGKRVAEHVPPERKVRVHEKPDPDAAVVEAPKKILHLTPFSCVGGGGGREGVGWRAGGRASSVRACVSVSVTVSVRGRACVCT